MRPNAVNADLRVRFIGCDLDVNRQQTVIGQEWTAMLFTARAPGS